MIADLHLLEVLLHHLEVVGELLEAAELGVAHVVHADRLLHVHPHRVQDPPGQQVLRQDAELPQLDQILKKNMINAATKTKSSPVQPVTLSYFCFKRGTS